LVYQVTLQRPLAQKNKQATRLHSKYRRFNKVHLSYQSKCNEKIFWCTLCKILVTFNKHNKFNHSILKYFFKKQ
jgi:hypothetical protein